MRLLVLDESPLLAWMVEQLSPPGTEVLALESFDLARRVVTESPPDAVVVNLGPAHLPWREFQNLCARRVPPVPMLVESAAYTSAQEVGLEADEQQLFFLHSPAPVADFAKAVSRLLDAAREARRRPISSEAEARTA